MIGDVNAATGRSTSNEQLGRPRRAAQTIDPVERHAEDIVRLVKGMEAKSKPREVHQLRTTIRRFETFLPDDGSDTPRAERKVRKQLDRLRKRAGKVRDVDVHLKALSGLPRALEAARNEVRDALRKGREKRQKRLLRALASERDRGLVKRLREVVGHPSAARVSTADPEQVLATVLERFRRSLAAATPLSRDNLHDFRIATKRLRYLAETAAPSAAAGTAVTELKRVQDAIGAWHDWLTLCAEAAAVLDDDSSALLTAIRARVDVQLEKALATTTRVGRRLEKLEPAAARKGVRRVTPVETAVPRRSAGASA